MNTPNDRIIIHLITIGAGRVIIAGNRIRVGDAKSSKSKYSPFNPFFCTCGLEHWPGHLRS